MWAKGQSTESQPSWELSPNPCALHNSRGCYPRRICRQCSESCSGLSSSHPLPFQVPHEVASSDHISGFLSGLAQGASPGGA